MEGVLHVDPSCLHDFDEHLSTTDAHIYDPPCMTMPH